MLKEVVAPNIDLLDEVKAYLRVTDTNSDNTINLHIASSIEYAQKYTNRQFGVATFELSIESLENGFKLPKNPVQSIEKIEYMDEDGVYKTLDSSLYYLYEEYGIGTIFLKEPISLNISHKYAIRITFIAGYDDIPPAIRSWISYKVMTLFDDRETIVSKFAHNILDQYRIRPLS